MLDGLVYRKIAKSILAMAWSLANFLRWQLITLGYDRRTFLCIDVSAATMEATTGAVLVAAEIRLFKVNANASLTKKDSTHLSVSRCAQFVSHASLKVARMSMIKIRTPGLNKWAFISYFFRVLVTYHDTVSLVRIEQFAS